jgi:tetratricopeptide (TPR) repeat protein
MKKKARKKTRKKAKIKRPAPSVTPSPKQQTLTIQQSLDLGVRHQNAGDFEKAKAIYVLILKADPDHPVALQLLGVIAHQVGENDIAVELITKAVTIKPAYEEGHYNLGIALKEQGKLEQAIASYHKALALNPDNADTHYNLGNALKDLGKFDEAVTSYRQAIAIRPDFPDAYCNLGYGLLQQKKLNKAVASFRKALAIKPNYAEAHSNLGQALLELGKPDEAVSSYRSALAIKPDFVEVLSNLGLALQEQGQLDAAMSSYEEALSIKPDHAEAHNNLGLVFQELGKLDKAMGCYEAALAIFPDFTEARNNIGMLQLLMGDFQNGWENYAWRWKSKDASLRPRPYQQPLWDGSSLAGRTIFIYPEQGLGDVIQFARYLPLVAAQGCRVHFEIQNPLYRLFEGNVLADSLLRANQTPPQFDCHAPLLNLPQLLQTTLQTIPQNDGFPEVTSELKNQWSKHFNPGDGFRLGIVWAGNPDHKNDRNRSIKGEFFQSLTNIPGLSVYSLQVGREGEAAHLFADKVTDLSPLFTDFADTAAAISHLDLILSADTSVAHLAGALGKPVWTLLPFMPDWRWLLDRDDTPWYPTMRLFRQKERGDWNDVLQRVGEALVPQLQEFRNGKTPERG